MQDSLKPYNCPFRRHSREDALPPKFTAISYRAQTAADSVREFLFSSTTVAPLMRRAAWTTPDEHLGKIIQPMEGHGPATLLVQEDPGYDTSRRRPDRSG
ncbi:hypothetical protein HGRIS_010400 [Hohenbuehelia grisea]|uniref:Uncharacterized protein n=1 Tax=Hohenbuehelia grisea TaxID=104357 RepID=A0ABR3J4M3_9AGAR